MDTKEKNNETIKNIGANVASISTGGKISANTAKKIIDKAEKIPVVNHNRNRVNTMNRFNDINNSLTNPSSSSNVSKALQKNKANKIYQKPKPFINNEENISEEEDIEENNEIDNENIEENTEKEEKTIVDELMIKARKKALALLAGIVPSATTVIIFILAVVIVMLPTIYINQNWELVKNNLSEFTDKTINFLTFKGWNTASEAFREKLYDGNTSEASKYNRLTYRDEEYDVPLITATLYALRTSNPDYAFSVNNSNGVYEGDTIVTVDKSDKAFYTFATAWLGSYDPLIEMDPTKVFSSINLVRLEDLGIDLIPSIGNGLSGHLVNYYIGYECTDGGLDIVTTLSQSISDNIKVSFDGFIKNNLISNIIEYINNVDKFKELGQDYKGSITLSKDFAALHENDTNKIVALFTNNRSKDDTYGYYGKGTCVQGAKTPVVKAYMDYDFYEKYLKEVYIPATYFLCEKCDDRDRFTSYLQSKKTNDIDKIYFDIKVNEIYNVIINSKNAYNDIYASNGNNSGYDILDTQKYDNIKVILEDNNNITIKTLTLDEYIKGVTYYYIKTKNITNNEVIKAIMVSLRSDIANKTLNNEITLENKKDPIYCDPYNGCSYSNAKETYVSGTNYDKLIESADTNTLNLLDTLMKDVDDVVVLNKNNGVLRVNTKSDLVEKYIQTAKEGINYNQIIISNVKTANTLSNNYSSGEYIYWSQWKAPWGEQPINPGVAPSTSTMHHYGCVITSVAILMAKSGTHINITPFDPGVFAKYMANYTSGGYYAMCSDGTGKICFRWNAAADTNLAPNFRYTGWIDLKGTNQDKLNTIKRYYNQGYYIALRVNNDSHSVALDHINGDKLMIIDPSSNDTTGIIELHNTKYGYNLDTTVGMNIYRKVD